MITQQQVFNILQQTTGQQNLLVIPRLFITLTGDINSALLLSQLIYWTDKSKNNGWIYKTYKELENEIGLNEYHLRKSKNKLEKLNLIETKIKKANGNPTIHYKIKDNFIDILVNFTKKDNFSETENDKPIENKGNSLPTTQKNNDFLRNQSSKFKETNLQNLKKPTFKNSRNQPLKIQETLTENTTEITTKNTTKRRKKSTPKGVVCYVEKSKNFAEAKRIDKEERRKEEDGLEKIQIFAFSKYFVEIFKKTNVFNNIVLPEKRITKKFLQIEQYLKDLLSGRFLRYDFDMEWLKKSNVKLDKLKDLNEEKLKLYLYKSFKRYEKAFLPNYMPFEKKYLTKDVKDFLYNERTKKSLFLYYIFNKPKEKKELVKENMKEKLPESIVKICSYLVNNYGFDELVFWSKIYDIYKFFEDNEQEIRRANNYMYFFLDSIFRVYIDYLDEFKNLSIGNIGYGNKTWESFVRFYRDEYGYDLDI